MIQHAPGLAFQIIEHILVVHSEDPTGKHTIPMVHQTDIIAVIATDLRQPVREVLPLGKKLFEAREAAIHRIAPRIDNGRVGQD